MTTIEIGGLYLRPLEETDAPRIAALCNDETLARNTSRLPHPYTLDEARRFIARAKREAETGAEYRFAVCDGDTVVACVGVMPKDGSAVE
ncbi:MAG: GNAT family N-acetyltransferase, partial [Hyphococcus sp.]